MSRRANHRNVLARVAPHWSIGPNANSDHIIEFTISQLSQPKEDGTLNPPFFMLETSQGDRQYARKQTALSREVAEELYAMLGEFLGK